MISSSGLKTRMVPKVDYKLFIMMYSACQTSTSSLSHYNHLFHSPHYILSIRGSSHFYFSIPFSYDFLSFHIFIYSPTSLPNKQVLTAQDQLDCLSTRSLLFLFFPSVKKEELMHLGPQHSYHLLLYNYYYCIMIIYFHVHLPNFMWDLQGNG